MPLFRMNIVKQKWEFLNKTKEKVPLQISKLYLFGLETLVGRSIMSLRANARLIPLNWYTVKSKIYRLSANTRIPNIFLNLITSLSLISEKDVVAVDFSDFGNGFQVLMFAKQTHRGRAVPIYFEILRYPIEKNSQNTFIINAIEHFNEIIGFKPTLVFDRGFACPSIVKSMFKNKQIFIIRIKKGKSAMETNGDIFLVKNSKASDTNVLMYGIKLRLVVSDQLKEMKEPWYLITNDTDSSRKKIIDRYYHRFEIEEFFRDAKRLLNLEHVRFEKSLSLSVVLWFTILGVWFFSSMEQKMDENDQKAKEAMELSSIRYLFEGLQREYVLSAEKGYLTLKCG